MPENGFLIEKVGFKTPFHAVIGKLSNCLLEVLGVITRNNSDKTFVLLSTGIFG